MCGCVSSHLQPPELSPKFPQHPPSPSNHNHSMPKKHRPKFLKPQTNSRFSSVSSSLSTKGQTVNDLLAHLRVSQPQNDTPRRQISVIPSVPPFLQQILANAEPPPPPRPPVQTGVPRPNRIPGPPPPASWLTPRIMERESEEATFKAEGKGHDLYHLPDLAYIEVYRLAHAALVAIVRNWEFHMVYDQHYLYALRPGLKSALLAYLAAHSSDGVKIGGLWVLFKDGDSEAGGEAESWEKENNNEDFKHMDLSRALGPDLTLKDLSNLFHPSVDTTGKYTSASTPDEIDTWDLSLPTRTRTRFPSLTHLSLSYPSSSVALWPRITSFTHFIPTITHLSLAGWPHPTAPTVLKHFARALLCLKWLDVSDCSAAFYKALMEVEWDRVWRGVETVVCRQNEGTPEGIREERERVVGELRRRIRAVRGAMGGRWCSVVE